MKSIRSDMWGITKHSNLGISVCVLLWLMAGKPCLSIGGDTLSKSQSLTGSQTLISKYGIFELGFSKKGTDSSQRIYLGIWFKDFPERIVWVANRHTPLPNTEGSKFEIDSNGNLALYNDFDSFWSTNLMSALPDTVEAVLLDDGNLILPDSSRPATIFWQSFDHPTDTWLPGAALVFNKITSRTQHLVSWKNTDDPSPGLFSVKIYHDQNFQFFLEWNMSTVYWRSGAWNGDVFGLVHICNCKAIILGVPNIFCLKIRSKFLASVEHLGSSIVRTLHTPAHVYTVSLHRQQGLTIGPVAVLGNPLWSVKIVTQPKARRMDF